MESTREQLVELLENQPEMTAGDIAKALLVSAADVRYHLSALRREGIVEVIKEGDLQENPQGKGQKRSVGRPAQRYRLSVHALGYQMSHLVEALLNELLSGTPSPLQANLLRRIASRMAGKGIPDGSLAKRLVQAVLRLNELGYQARWEARPGDPQVQLGHCPYLSILPDHPELCLLDKVLLESMLAVPTIQTAKLEPDLQGGKYCRFVIGRESP